MGRGLWNETMFESELGRLSNIRAKFRLLDAQQIQPKKNPKEVFP
jgi:hypothetical protein